MRYIAIKVRFRRGNHVGWSVFDRGTGTRLATGRSLSSPAMPEHSAWAAASRYNRDPTVAPSAGHWPWEFAE